MVQTSNLPLDRLSCLLKTYFLNTDLKYRIKLLPVSIDVYINAQYEKKPANQKDDVAIQTRVKKFSKKEESTRYRSSPSKRPPLCKRPPLYFVLKGKCQFPVQAPTPMPPS